MTSKTINRANLLRGLIGALFVLILAQVMAQLGAPSTTTTAQQILVLFIVLPYAGKWVVIKHLSQPLHPALKMSFWTLAFARESNAPLGELTEGLIRPISKSRLVVTAVAARALVALAHLVIASTALLVAWGWSFTGTLNLFLVASGVLVVVGNAGLAARAGALARATRLVTDEGYLDAQAYVNASAYLADPRMFTAPLVRVNDSSVMGVDPDYSLSERTLIRGDAKHGDPVTIPPEALKRPSVPVSATEHRKADTYVEGDGSPRYGVRE